MNKWIELDKNNLPSDILVEGKYEFRGFVPTAREHFTFSYGLSALADVGINRRVEYRKKAIEPKVFKARVIEVERKMDQAPGRYESRLLPSTVIIIKAQGYINLPESEDVTVTFSPIDE